MNSDTVYVKNQVMSTSSVKELLDYIQQNDDQFNSWQRFIKSGGYPRKVVREIRHSYRVQQKHHKMLVQRCVPQEPRRLYKAFLWFENEC